MQEMVGMQKAGMQEMFGWDAEGWDAGNVWLGCRRLGCWKCLGCRKSMVCPAQKGKKTFAVLEPSAGQTGELPRVLIL